MHIYLKKFCIHGRIHEWNHSIQTKTSGCNGAMDLHPVQLWTDVRDRFPKRQRCWPQIRESRGVVLGIKTDSLAFINTSIPWYWPSAYPELLKFILPFSTSEVYTVLYLHALESVSTTHQGKQVDLQWGTSTSHRLRKSMIKWNYTISFSNSKYVKLFGIWPIDIVLSSVLCL